MQNQDQAQVHARLILDYQIVSAMGIFNSSCHLIGSDSLQQVGILWQAIRVAQVDPEQPVPYFGGYLSLIAIGQMLIFIYLLLFYCKPINKSKNLIKLRFVICLITICISILAVAMILTKTIQYIRQTQVKDDKYYLIVVTNIMDILITKYITPSYLFITICHYRQLQIIRIYNQNPIETERQQINNYIQGRVEENIQIQVGQEGVDNIREINLNSQ